MKTRISKLNRLLVFHRQNVFNDGPAGDRHERALKRLKKTETFRQYCDQNRNASDRMLFLWA